MDVVGHQHVSMDRAASVARRLGEPAAVADIAGLVKEDRLAVVAALDHVQRLIRQEIAAGARHGGGHILNG